jgi:MoaA/NifB/PqqE/SkfB family radical SAM enzyme
MFISKLRHTAKSGVLKAASRYLKTKGPFCNQPWNTIFIRWNGEKVMPCCYGPHDLGDLNFSSYDDIWNGNRYRTLRKQISTGDVRGTCLPCYQKKRSYTDHITPFLDRLFTKDKGENLRMSIRNYIGRKETVQNSPYVIYLDISSACNIRCRKCYVYALENVPPLGHMTMEVFSKISPLFRNAMKVICTGTGESLLNPHFMDMLDIIKRNECSVSFNTNGRLLNEERALRMVEMGIDEMIFSIDAISSDLYNYLHRGGDHDLLMANIRRLGSMKQKMASQKPRLAWCFVAMRSNIDELPEIVKNVGDLGFSEVQVLPLIPAVKGHNREYITFFEEQNLENAEDKDRAKQVLNHAEQIALRTGLDFKSHVLS